MWKLWGSRKKWNVFKLKNKENSTDIIDFEIIEFINENNFLKNIDTLFSVKVDKTTSNQYYIIYFKYKDIKLAVSIGIEGDINICICYNGIWKELNEENLNKHNISEGTYNKIEDITNELKNELFTNTKLRIRSLLNKENIKNG